MSRRVKIDFDIIIFLVWCLALVSVFFVAKKTFEEIATRKNCLEWKTETYWRKPYITFFVFNKTLIPQFHPGHFVDRKVCIKKIETN